MKTSMTIVYITTELLPTKSVKATLYTLRKWLKKIRTPGNNKELFAQLLINEIHSKDYDAHGDHLTTKKNINHHNKMMSDEEIRSIANDNLVNEWRELLEKAIEKKQRKQ